MNWKRLRLLAALLLVSLVRAQLDVAFAQPPRDGQAAATSSGTATVFGVVSGPSGRPLRAVRVSLIDSATRVSRMAITDDAGRFRFPPVVGGYYVLSGSKPGYVPVSYGELSPGSGRGATPIHISTGQQLEVRLDMPAGSVMTGRIVDERGDPAPRTMVRAFRVETRTVRPSARPVGSDVTDDRGIYRIYGLNPGDYLLCATPSNEIEVRSTKPASEESRGGYAPICYPGMAAAADARMIRLRAAQEREALDIQLDVVPLSYVEGVVTGAPDGVTTHVSLVDTGETLHSVSLPSVQATADGYFRLSGVPQGTYMLVARTGPSAQRPIGLISSALAAGDPARQESASLWGSISLTVTGQPVRNVVVGVRPGMIVSGRVKYLPSKPLAFPLTIIRTVARLVPADGIRAAGELAQQVTAPVQSDGTFRITGVTPGTYRLVAVTEGVWNLLSALIDGRDTLDFPVEIRAGQDVADAEITFTDRRTALSGQVGPDTAPFARPPTVVLFSADRELRLPSSRRLLSARVATDGRYTFPDVPPGAYRIAAIMLADPDRLDDPTFLEQLEPQTAAVTLTEGEQKVMSLQMSTYRLGAR